MINYQNTLKWWQTIKISWVKHTAYRLNFFLQIIGPALVFFFVKYNLWTSIFNQSNETIIQGYNLKQMITYHAWAFIISLIAQGHGSWNLSEDIRMGRISSYLIYPFNFWEFHTASFLSFQSIQLIIAGFTLFLFSFLNIIAPFTTQLLLTGVLFTLYVSFFWYLTQFFTGLLAFWLEETWILRVMLQIIAVFLSGAIIPLELYPEWLVDILNFTPFPYLSYYPIQIMMGREVSLINGIGIIGFWIVFLIFVNRLIWKRGLKLYTAAGM
ncbi:ABC-2 family transporter protein [Bacteriovoracaceae bacterium]|nr:ABC-2 family transporter protein [Bacteriovoracaceae bacterium]|tara:strand:- start:78606 stop:79412 length:807 start_codon:yes stop_codon:yes gene_type:complete